MKLKIALAQINTRLGDVQSNLEKHLALAGQARQAGMDLLVFPELSSLVMCSRTSCRQFPAGRILMTRFSAGSWMQAATST